MGEFVRQAVRVGGEVGRLAMQLEDEEERGLVLLLKGLHNLLAQVRVAGALSRLVREEEEVEA